MKKTIFSLALGTFGLGMAEFGIMGVLTELAHDTGISIPFARSKLSSPEVYQTQFFLDKSAVIAFY